MANVKDDEYETLDFADESEWADEVSYPEDSEHETTTWPPSFGGQPPREPEYPNPRPHWSVRNPVERASIILGEARDV